MSGPTVGELFAGAGGIGMAVKDVWPETRIAWVSDIKPGANKVLAHRFPAAPNLGDITKIDWATVEPVDIITGGSPCQDLSHAGKRMGMKAGTRSGLWASMLEGIKALRPSLVIWENVRGAYSAEADSALEPCAGCVGDRDDTVVLRALGRVLGDLADVGYDAAWVGLRAADVGAPHGRFRVFVLAWPADAENVGLEWRWQSRNGWAGLADNDRELVALPTPMTINRTSAKAQSGRPTSGPSRGGASYGNGHGKSLSIEAQRLEGTFGQYAPAIARWEAVLGREAPAPVEPTGRDGANRLSARFTEFMMGWPDGWVTDVPDVTRNEALSICGDGVVPQQAETAVRHLLDVRATASASVA